MKDVARRKQYVEVVATHYIDGSVRPQKIVLATGPVYEIEDSREAARLTGCKNFSRARRLDAHTVEAEDWGIILHTKGEIPEDVQWLGYRAHDFVPVWGERGENMLRFDLESSALLPFERNYYLRSENSAGYIESGAAADTDETERTDA